MKKTVLNCVWLGCVGGSIGWLIGMSVSPVIQGVITSLLAVGSTLLIAVCGLSRENGESPLVRPEATLPPAAAFFVFLAISATFAIEARVNEWFGFDPSGYAEKWAGTGLTAKEIQVRLFEHDVAVRKGATKRAGLLSDISVDELEELMQLIDDPVSLRQRMSQSSFNSVVQLEASEKDNAELTRRIKLLCQP